MKTCKNYFYVLLLQMLGQVSYFCYRLVINYLGVTQTEQEGQVSIVSAVAVDGHVDRFQVVMEIHETYGTLVKMMQGMLRYSYGTSSSIDTILFSNSFICLVSLSGFFSTSTACLEVLRLTLPNQSSSYSPSIIIYAGAGFSSSDIQQMEKKQAKMSAIMGWVQTLMTAMKRMVGRLVHWQRRTLRMKQMTGVATMMKRTKRGIFMNILLMKVQSRKLKGICMRPTHLVPLNPYCLLKAKFQQVPKMLIHIGNPPRAPETMLAIARTLVQVVTSPKVPQFLYFLPLRSNSSRQRNCSKRITIAMTSEAGITSISQERRGCLRLRGSTTQKVQSMPQRLQMSEYDLKVCCILAKMPKRARMPISGIFQSFCLRKNIRKSSTMVMVRVTTLKFRNSRLRTLKGLEVASYWDIRKKASIFYIAKGKNYILAFVPVIRR